MRMRGRGGVVVAAAKEKPSVATLTATGGKDFPGREGDFLKVYAAGSDDEVLNVASDYAGDKFIAYLDVAVAGGAGKDGRRPRFTGTSLRWGRREIRFIRLARELFIRMRLSMCSGRWTRGVGAVWRGEDRALSDEMMGYWTNFAKTSDPEWGGVACLAEVWAGEVGGNEVGDRFGRLGRIRGGSGICFWMGPWGKVK